MYANEAFDIKRTNKNENEIVNFKIFSLFTLLTCLLNLFTDIDNFDSHKSKGKRMG
jgi:hypothetical protein